MKNNHMAVMVCVALATLAIGLVSPAYAQMTDEVSLPSSKNLSQRIWDEMNANANKKTIEAARAQCDRFADMVSDDEVTLVHCAVFQEKLRSGQCRSVEAGEITFDFLGGRNNSTSRNITKQTGQDDLALLCDLNDGVYAYWFMQESKESCNNVGVVITNQIDPPKVRKKVAVIRNCPDTIFESTVGPSVQFSESNIDIVHGQLNCPGGVVLNSGRRSETTALVSHTAFRPQCTVQYVEIEEIIEE